MLILKDDFENGKLAFFDCLFSKMFSSLEAIFSQ